MYYQPNARITVGSVVFEKINKFVITESVKEMGDSARVILPRNFKKLNGKSPLDFMKEGDKVLIEAGTGGNYYTEFEGYLGYIGTGAPLELQVDDAFYPLKRNTWKKSWAKVSLKEVLNFIAQDYEINAPDVNLGKFQINNASSYRVLRALQQQYGFYSFIRSNVLNCQFAYDVRGTGNEYRYKFGNNIKHNGLIYQRQEDIKIKVRGIANQRNGKKFTYETGDMSPQAALRTLNYGPISESELKEVVEKTYSRLAFDGYTGDITGFAMPRVHAGDTLKIIDDNEKGREGRYLVEKTIITYDLKAKGFERKNTLSFKI